MRRAVILFPSGFTLGNLFFGVFAIIAASRLEFTAAGVYVMLGGICDALDGRVARATNSGTEFGEELDSLVDAISFGLAPAMIMYFAVLNRDGWDWVFVFIFAACAVLRLARFNIEQAGTAKTYFQGLPSPAAGITLASYYWFSQSWLYDYGKVGDLPWHVMLRFIMAGLSMLMVTNVPYPTFPRMGFSSLRSVGATVLVLGAIALLATRRLEFFFPIALVYVAWGLARWVFFGLFERRQPTLPYDLSEGEDEDEDDVDDFDMADSRVHASRQGHRDELAARPERLRSRGGRAEADDAPSAHPDRVSRKPERADRPERPERAERPDRTERAAVERPAQAERTTRRDKKKERPERPERPDRADRADRAERPKRSDRPERAPRSEPAAAAQRPSIAAPAPTGVDAITLGEPSEPSMIEEVDETFGADEGGDLQGADTAPPTADGAPPRKRKRRRRRGERKERGTGDRPASDAGATSSGAGEVDASPYAASPTAYAPPTPTEAPAPPPASAPMTASLPPAPFPPSPLRSAGPSSSEPSE
jgi:CDP-diacylglycerol--serine O-phosphatidyltransferase